MIVHDSLIHGKLDLMYTQTEDRLGWKNVICVDKHALLHRMMGDVFLACRQSRTSGCVMLG